MAVQDRFQFYYINCYDVPFHYCEKMTFLDILVDFSKFFLMTSYFFCIGWLDGWLEVPMEQVWPHKKSLIFGEKMVRFLEFFGEKNSSPVFSKPVRARAFKFSILLVGNIKPCNLYYYHFLLIPPPCNILAVPVLLWGFRLTVRHCSF